MKISLPSLHQKFRAFTLMELLVVVAIIGILASLMFPAVNGALNSARKAMAQNDVVQIANAVTMYQTEYGKFPPSSGSGVSGALLQALTATSTNDNPRRIIFLEAPEKKKNRSGTNSTSFLDPWDGLYQIAMNTNYDVPPNLSVGQGGIGSTNINKQVGVWNTNSNKRLCVASW